MVSHHCPLEEYNSTKRVRHPFCSLNRKTTNRGEQHGKLPGEVYQLLSLPPPLQKMLLYLTPLLPLNHLPPPRCSQILIYLKTQDMEELTNH